MAMAATAFRPRKTPIQARSAVTVEAILEATLQVLIEVGPERLTTTRVAERAGVAVGSLYQYFPNKQSLLSTVLDRHLTAVVEVVEAACAASKGRPARTMAAALVGAFIDAKLRRPEASRALYGVASDLDGAAMVARLTQRTQLAICDMLATAPDVRFGELGPISFILTTALVGPVQALLETVPSPAIVAGVRSHLVAMADAYLHAVALRQEPQDEGS